MNRVLSFPQSHSCNNPAEAVSKRFCFSCVFSLSFISLIMGYLLGSRQSNVNTRVPLVKSKVGNNYIEMLQSIQATDKLINESVTSHILTDYEEVLLLQEYFKANNLDQISPIITSEVTLTFKNKFNPDVLEIIVDKGDIHYRNVRNSSYTYLIPDEAEVVGQFTNTVSGIPVYGNFGTERDFNFLIDQGISLHGCIILLRLGKTSIFDKVSEALKRGVNGILLFADPQQYPGMDCFSAHEEISPVILTSLQKLRETFDRNSNCNVAVQIIEAMTAKNILREMAVEKEPPDSWRGSLSIMYPVGRGFIYESWRLIMYSYFITVHYKTYDIAAYLRGAREPDRYVVVANSRRILNEKNKISESTKMLMEVSETLAELKNKKKWMPTRTLVFVSFGLEDTESSKDSWFQKHIDVITQRTVTYLNLRQPITGLNFFAAINPAVESLFSNMSSSVALSPKKMNELNKNNKTLFDVWRRKPNKSINNHKKIPSCGNNNQSISISTIDTAGSKIFSALGIPTVSFGFISQNDLGKTDERIEEISDIEEFKKAVVQLWELLAFSLADRTVLPFNFTIYAIVIENYKQILFSQQKIWKDLNITAEFDGFVHSTENLTTSTWKFQNEIQSADSTNTAKNRIINEKLTYMQRLFVCVLNTYDSLFNVVFEEVSFETETIRHKLIRGKNCVTQLDYHFVRSLYY